MTQLDLNFNDLLRHSDWRVEPCFVWWGSTGEWASGESHQRVIHRANSALYVIPRMLRSIVSPKMRSFATWPERRALVRFALEVIRLDGISAAWRVPGEEAEPELENKKNTASIEFLGGGVPPNLDTAHCRLSAVWSGMTGAHSQTLPVRVITRER